jgi:hypothetical protein
VVPSDGHRWTLQAMADGSGGQEEKASAKDDGRPGAWRRTCDGVGAPMDGEELGLWFARWESWSDPTLTSARPYGAPVVECQPLTWSYRHGAVPGSCVSEQRHARVRRDTTYLGSFLDGLPGALDSVATLDHVCFQTDRTRTAMQLEEQATSVAKDGTKLVTTPEWSGRRLAVLAHGLYVIIVSKRGHAL